MKILINKTEGGFGISEKAMNLIADNNTALFDEFVKEGAYDPACDEWYGWELEKWRTDPVLISELESLIENDFPIRTCGSNVVVIEIPDNATDWMVTESFGYENIYYVVNGKIEIA